MIKLYNNSKLSDKIIMAIAKESYKQAKCKDDVILLITKGCRGGGLFSCGGSFKDTRFGHYRWVSAFGGKVTINPYIKRPYGYKVDPLEAAEYMAELFLHEFKHASDYQNKFEVFNHYTADGKRIQHNARKHEVRAYVFSRYEAKISDNLILDLAIEIEALTK